MTTPETLWLRGDRFLAELVAEYYDDRNPVDSIERAFNAARTGVGTAEEEQSSQGARTAVVTDLQQPGDSDASAQEPVCRCGHADRAHYGGDGEVSGCRYGAPSCDCTGFRPAHDENDESTKGTAMRTVDCNCCRLGSNPGGHSDECDTVAQTRESVEKPICESCYVEWATVRAPKQSGLTRVCAGCRDASWPPKQTESVERFKLEFVVPLDELDTIEAHICDLLRQDGYQVVAAWRETDPPTSYDETPATFLAELLDSIAFDQTTTRVELIGQFGPGFDYDRIMFELGEAGHFVVEATEPEKVWKRVRVR